MKNILYLALVCCFTYGCHELDPNFEFKQLSDFEYQPADLAEGTTVKIISFSGGPGCTDKETYYYQYIGIVKGTDDTVRVISPCQQIPEGSQPEEGSFNSWAKRSPIVDSVLHEYGEKSFETGKKLVVFNKHNLALEKGNYKTAVGSLSF